MHRLFVDRLWEHAAKTTRPQRSFPKKDYGLLVATKDAGSFGILETTARKPLPRTRRFSNREGKRLLNVPSDPDVAQQRASVPLTIVDLNGESVSPLLEKGTDVDTQDNNTATALMSPSLQDHAEVLQNCANVNVSAKE